MTDITVFVGLDVHKKTITVALVEAAAGGNRALLWHDRDHAGYGTDVVPQAGARWAATAFCL
jgi:hypothetical protein